MMEGRGAIKLDGRGNLITEQKWVVDCAGSL